jgi:hypothetical protein
MRSLTLQKEVAVTMKINGSGLLEQRALQLAIVHLSRRDDLMIKPSKDEYGIVYLTWKMTKDIFGGSYHQPMLPDYH